MTMTRRALWLAQLLRPEVSHLIATRVTLTGPLDIERLTDVVMRVVEYVGWDDVHIPPHYSPADPDCIDPLRPAQSGVPAIEYVDLTGYADPVVESERRANEFVDDPGGADLTNPLWRSQLHALGPHSHRWIVRAHHVLTDGAGALRIVSHVADVYTGRSAPEDLEVPDDRELEADEHSYLRSARYTDDVEFWRSELERHTPSYLSITPTTATSTVTRVTRRVTGSRSPDALEALAAMAGFCSRMLDTDDVGLSLPVAARNTALRRRSLQPVSNVVPVTLNGFGDLNARDAVGRARTAVVGALRHQLCPRAEILADRGGLPDFGAVVNLLPAFEPPAPPGLALQWDIELLRTGPVTDVAASVHPIDDWSTAVSWEAPRSLFDTQALSELADRFDGYLTSMVDEIDGAATIPDKAVFLPGEWEGFSRRSGAPAPDFHPTAKLLDDLCAADDAGPAVIDGEVMVSRGQLRAGADHIAGALLETGVRPGDPVAVNIDRSVASVVAFWGVFRAGAVWVPINDPFAPLERTLDILERAGVTVGLGTAPDPGGRGDIRWIDLEECCPEVNYGEIKTSRPTAERLPGVDRGPDDRAYILFTSGSTGRPKGVDMPHRGIPSLVTEIRKSYGLDADSRLLHASAQTFDTAFVEMLAAVATGAPLVVAGPAVRGGDEMAGLITRHGITHILVTPSVLDTLPPALAPRLTRVIIGGESAPAQLIVRWADRVDMRNAYGPTETRCSVNLSAPMRPDRLVTVGPPMVGVTEAILDRRGRPQPPGAVGMLYTAGPQVADGYLDAPDLTAEVFRESTISDDTVMYCTGDLATWTPDGDVRLLGRRDGQVKIRGLRIELGEVDAVLADAPGVRACATLVRKAARDREILVSFVVADDPSSPPKTGELRSYLSRVLPTYMLPASVVFLDELPRTGHNKLDTRRLAELDVLDHAGARAPRGDAEALVTSVVAETLGIDTVDPDAGFLDHGGDSLAVMRAARLLAEAGYPEIGPNGVLTAPTLAALAATMGEPTAAVPPQSGQDTRPTIGDRPLTAPQRTVGRDPRDPYAQTIRFALAARDAPAGSVDDIRRVCDSVLDRHPVLRSTFPDTPDGPVQRTMAEAPTEVLTTSVSDHTPDREELASLVDEMAAALDVRTAAPVAVHVVTDRHGGVRALAVVLHHIAVDGPSLEVLAGDVAAVAMGAAPSRAPASPATLESAPDRRFWTELLGKEPESSWTLAGIDPRSLAAGPAVRRVFDVDAVAYERFCKQAAHDGITPFEAFRFLVGEALVAITGDRRIVSATPKSVRPPGYDDAVGDFTISAITVADAEESARTATTLVRRCLEAATQPMEDILDLVDRSAEPGKVFPVPMLIGWQPAPAIPEDIGDFYMFPPSGTRWLLQVEASPLPNDGGAQIQLTGLRAAFDEDLVEQLGAAVVSRFCR